MVSNYVEKRDVMQNNMEKTQGLLSVEELPNEAAVKCQRCKNCKYMRMPHRSNAHYSCQVRHTNIEPTWTCKLFNDKHNQKIS